MSQPASIMQRLFGSNNNPQQQATSADNPNMGQPGTSTSKEPGAIADPKITSAHAAPDNPTTTIEGQKDQPKSPLDQFAEVFKIDPNNKPEEKLSFNADPAQIFESAKQVDFKRYVTPEHLQAVVQGGEGAANALLDILNSSSQAVYANSALASTKLIEAALEAQDQRFNQALPSKVRDHAVTESLSTANPLFNHPAMAPVINNLRTAISTKYPDMPAADVTKQVQEFVTAFATSFAPKQEQQGQQTNKSQTVDWEDFLNG